MYGPQPGIGMLADADWWLAITVLWEGETAAAAAPATTTDRAITRMASFMIFFLFKSEIWREVYLSSTEW
jgi:hypothetical protein